jgi:hypothetical protein
MTIQADKDENDPYRRNVAYWPKASFRQDAEFGRYRGIADIVRLAAGSTGSRMTHNVTSHCKLTQREKLKQRHP